MKTLKCKEYIHLNTYDSSFKAEKTEGYRVYVFGHIFFIHRTYTTPYRWTITLSGTGRAVSGGYSSLKNAKNDLEKVAIELDKRYLESDLNAVRSAFTDNLEKYLK